MKKRGRNFNNTKFSFKMRPKNISKSTKMFKITQTDSLHDRMFELRWLDRLKNEDIHQIYDVFENTIFKTLEHL